MQIPLLHLFPRVEGAYRIRIPSSGWLDEVEPGQRESRGGHRVDTHVARSHRFQRTARDEDAPEEGRYLDHVSVALFSVEPGDLRLYG